MKQDWPLAARIMVASLCTIISITAISVVMNHMPNATFWEVFIALIAGAVHWFAVAMLVYAVIAHRK